MFQDTWRWCVWHLHTLKSYTAHRKEIEFGWCVPPSTLPNSNSCLDMSGFEFRWLLWSNRFSGRKKELNQSDKTETSERQMAVKGHELGLTFIFCFVWQAGDSQRRDIKGAGKNWLMSTMAWLFIVCNLTTVRLILGSVNKFHGLIAKLLPRARAKIWLQNKQGYHQPEHRPQNKIVMLLRVL